MWISTEHQGAPNDMKAVLIRTGEADAPDTEHTVGYYSKDNDAWYIKSWAGRERLDGYKGVAYWQPLPCAGVTC